MKKIFHLASCDTCRRILKELEPGDEVILQEIKSQPLTPGQLDKMAALAGGYEPLFSRRARKYKSLGLKDKQLSEEDCRKLILEEYSFLKRPVIMVDDKIFIGNAAKTIAEAKPYFK